MTLVLPYGPDQIGNTPVYSGSVRNSNMPCVFDGEALDFESALMTDWNSDINVYETSADGFSTRSPSDASDLKRKLSSAGSDAQATQPKKQRTDVAEDLISPLQSGVVSSSSSCSSSSSSSSSSSDGQEEDASSTPDEEEYIPRRRGPQMWNSRQRWKDERKRVLKLSLSKLAEIEDPELCMHRSVVINNTVKRLHMDIKNERQAKLRQRQQRMDLFNERFNSPERIGSAEDSRRDKASSPSVDSYDDSSCDEMFGISEDFLRVTIPDRRVPTPIPTNPISQPVSEDSRDSQMDTSEPPVTSRVSHTTCYSSTNSSSMPCDTAMDSASSSSLNARRTGAITSTNTTATNTTTTTNNNSNSSTGSSSSPRRLVSSVSTNSGSQCATQYRTSREASSNSSFDPRVPILDSVVYHSLLASLESS